MSLGEATTPFYWVLQIRYILYGYTVYLYESDSNHQEGNSILDTRASLHHRIPRWQKAAWQSWTSERFTRKWDAFFLLHVQFYQMWSICSLMATHFWKCSQDIFGWKILAHHPFQQPKSLIHNFLPQQKSPDPSPQHRGRNHRLFPHSVSYEVFGSVTALGGRDRRSEKTSAAKAEDLSWFTMRRFGPPRRADSSITGQKEILCKLYLSYTILQYPECTTWVAMFWLEVVLALLLYYWEVLVRISTLRSEYDSLRNMPLRSLAAVFTPLQISHLSEGISKAAHTTDTTSHAFAPIQSCFGGNGHVHQRPG